MRRLDAFVAVLSLVLLVGSAAGMVASAPLPPVPRPSYPPLPPPADPMVLREGLVGTVRVLDPLFASTTAERDVAALLFRGLTRVGPDGRIEPDLARAWQVEDGGRAYTIEIPGRLRWHDGFPVTADDVVATVATVQHPDYEGPHAAGWTGVTVERIDRFTVRFVLDEPLAAFAAATTIPLVPAHLVSDVPVAARRSSAFASAPVGTGPFVFRSMNDAQVILGRWGPPLGGEAATFPPEPDAPLPEPTPERAPSPRPIADRYTFRLYSDEDALLAAFERGEIDAAGGLAPEPTRRVADESDATVLRYPRGLMTAVFPNLRSERAIMHEPLVRRALSAAIDRQGIVARVLGGAGVAVQSPVWPTSFAYDPDFSEPPVYDPGAAGTLLASAGWQRSGSGWTRPGVSGQARVELLTVAGSEDPIPSAVAEGIAEGWRTLGIEVTVTPLDSATLAARIRAATFEAVVLDVDLGLDPDLFPLLVSHQAPPGGTNIPGFQSAVVDSLLAATRRYADEDTRKRRFSLLQALLVRELPIVPICFQDYTFLVRDGLVGPQAFAVARPGDRYRGVLAWKFASGSDE